MAITQGGKTIFSHDRYNRLVMETFEEVTKLSTLKGAEYSGDTDRLLNFRRNAEALGLPKEIIWAVYAAKHWDAIMQAIRDIHAGKSRITLESLEGRCDDLITYLILFKAMLIERAGDVVERKPMPEDTERNTHAQSKVPLSYD